MSYTKAEYIERFGEEAWLEQKKKKAEYDKIRNTQRAKEKRLENKEYYKKNKERIHNKYISNIEKKKEYNKQYNITHKEEISLNKKEYYSNNKEERSAYNKSYYLTENGKSNHMISDYKREDKKNDRKGFNLTQKWILDSIFSSKCIYCGDDDWRHLGCDRIDNEKAHTTDNCICACGICNIERQQKRMSVEEFIEYRKTHPRDAKFELPQKVVEINGKKVIKKVV